MQAVHPICRGIDVHQAQLTACLRRVDADGQVTQEVSSITIDSRSDHDCATVAPYLGHTGDHFGRIEPHPDHGMGLERWRMFSHQPNGHPASGSPSAVARVMWPPNKVWSSPTG
jgi:hypothetical protein